MNSTESVSLSFGDVVQFGNADPESGKIRWFGLEVVARCMESDSIEAFPVTTDENGTAYLELPGTTGGTDVRIFGKLSLAQVRELLVPDSKLEHREIFLGIYTKEEKAAAPAQVYAFRLHE